MSLSSPVSRILVLGPAWVGDMVLAHSLFQVIKQQEPDTVIDVAAPAWTLPLIERMPEVSGKIALPFKHGQLGLSDRIKFGKSLRSAGYTQAILLTNSLKSAILPFAANIPKRTGFLGEMRYGLLNDIRPLNKATLPRTVDRFVALALDAKVSLPTSIPNPRLVANSTQAESALQRLGEQLPQKPVLGLCSGAEFGEAKRWPAEYYAEVAKYALKKGWEVWLFGSEKDVPVTTTINALTQNRCLDLGGRTKLGQAIDLMSLTTTVVSNDSGLMHVAAALGKKVIAIYGSSDPHHTPPMSDKAVIEYLGLECSPCFKRECPLGHLNCLRQLSPKSIMQHLT
ncbi:MAG: lipopolysaccharide heptosyltransferase II, partial [Methylophilaceae bacterium]|nr:lipopolysaccharide heptosyltransferase II [Methylophilaceae bacterium]